MDGASKYQFLKMSFKYRIYLRIHKYTFYDLIFTARETILHHTKEGSE